MRTIEVCEDKKERESVVEKLLSLFCIVTAAVGCSGTQHDRAAAERLLFAGLKYREKALAENRSGAGLRAMDSFNRAIAADPGYGKAYMERGKQLLMGNLQLPKAEQAFRRALECTPDLEEAKAHLVDTLLRQDKSDEAFTFQQELVDEYPSNPLHWNNLGGLYLRRSQWGEAVFAYRRALELKEDYPSAQKGLGIALWRHGNQAEGITLLRRAVLAAPRDVVLRCELIKALIAAQLYPEAEENIKIALELEPDEGLVYHRYAELLVARGRLERAQAMAQQALQRGCRIAPDLADRLSGFKS